MTTLFEKLTTMIKSEPNVAIPLVKAESIHTDKFSGYEAFDREYKKLTEVFVGVGSGPRRIVLDGNTRPRDLILKAFDTKLHLAKLLRLGPDFRYEVETNMSGDTAIAEEYHFKIFREFTHYMVAMSTGSTEDKWLMVYNSKDAITSGIVEVGGRKLRTSKFLAGLVDNKIWTKWVVRRGARLPEKQINDFNVFSAALFELSKTKKLSLVISANPMDMILSSEAAGFTSCHSLSSSHANGNLSYMRDPQTLILFLRSSSPKEFPYKKLCRMWLYIDPKDNQKFVIGRAYGNVSKQQIADISELIGTRISESLGIDNEWRAVSDAVYPEDLLTNAGHRSNSHDRYPIYFDTTVSRFSYHQSLNPAERLGWRQLLPALSFPKIECLSCGFESNSRTNLSCGPCNEYGQVKYRCASCKSGSNTPLEVDPDTQKDACKSCYEAKFFTCGQCKVKTSKKVDPGTSVVTPTGSRTGTTIVCKGCRDEHFTLVASLGVFVTNEKVGTAYNLAGKEVKELKTNINNKTLFGSLEELEAFKAAEKEKAKIKLSQLKEQERNLDQELIAMLREEPIKFFLDGDECERAWKERKTKFQQAILKGN